MDNLLTCINHIPGQKVPLQCANESRACSALEDGQYRKAMQYLTSGGLAQASADVVNEMLAKHPRAATPLLPVYSVLPPVQVAKVNVIKALRSFPFGTAPGPSRGLPNRSNPLRHKGC